MTALLVAIVLAPSLVAVPARASVPESSWSQESTPQDDALPGGYQTSAVSCDGSWGICLAVGGGQDVDGDQIVAAMSSSDGGQTWSTEDPAQPSPPAWFEGDDCESGTCYAVGHSGYAGAYDTPVFESLDEGSDAWSQIPMTTGGGVDATTGDPGQRWTSYTSDTDPGTAEPTEADLDAISCAASGDGECTMVGTYSSSTPWSSTVGRGGGVIALAETYSPAAGWAILPTEVPSPDPGYYFDGDQFSSVSCSEQGDCAAAGSWTEITGYGGTTQTFPLLELFDDGGQANLEPFPGSDSPGVLTSAGCVPDTHSDQDYCMAVGYSGAAGSTSGLELHWAGSDSVPSISSDPIPEPGQADQAYDGVYCVSSTYCVAVGSYQASASIQSALVADWDGASWSEDPVGGVAGSQAALSAVSCPDVDQVCAAVGTDSSSVTPLAESPVPSGVAAQQYVAPGSYNPMPTSVGQTELSGISCSSTTYCAAVGYSEAGSGSGAYTAPVAETYDGTSWRAGAPGDPDGSAGDDLTGVSCMASPSSTCLAVGEGQDGDTSWPGGTSQSTALADEWNGEDWSSLTPPDPAQAYGAGATPVDGASLLGVSCTSDACFTAGFESSPDHAQGPMVLEWDGSSWTDLDVPFPGTQAVGEETSGADGPSAYFDSISCVSDTYCVAAGAITYTTDQSGQVSTYTGAFIESWNGSVWSQDITNSVAGSTAYGVSCQVSTSSPTQICLVVGRSPTSDPFILECTAPSGSAACGTDGDVFQSQDTGVDLHDTYSVLSGVSCATDYDCTATGYYQPAAGGSTVPLVISTSGTAPDAGPWTQVTQLPAYRGQDVHLDAVTCQPGDDPVTFCLTSGSLGPVDPGDPTDTLVLASADVAPPVVTGLINTEGPPDGGSQPVEVDGSGFTDASAVRFGDVAADFRVVSDSVIDATAPASDLPGDGEGTVDVTVAGAGGTSATSSADQYEYDCEDDDPEVDSVAPDTGPVAGGTGVTVDGSGFDCISTSDVYFDNGTSGNNATDVTVDSDTELTATTPPSNTGASQTVDVEVDADGNWSDDSAGDEFTYVGPLELDSVDPTNGYPTGGTEVTLNGSGFTDATEVDFGNRAASFSVESDSQIVAESPPGTDGDLVLVSVTSPEGTSNKQEFEYDSSQPHPEVDSISPSSGSEAGGDEVTITGAGFNGSGSGFTPVVSFGAGNPSPSVTVDSDSEIVAVSPPGTGTVDVTVQTDQAVSPTSSADLFTYQPGTGTTTTSSSTTSSSTTSSSTSSTSSTSTTVGSSPTSTSTTTTSTSSTSTSTTSSTVPPTSTSTTSTSTTSTSTTSSTVPSSPTTTVGPTPTGTFSPPASTSTTTTTQPSGPDLQVNGPQTLPLDTSTTETVAVANTGNQTLRGPMTVSIVVPPDAVSLRTAEPAWSCQTPGSPGLIVCSSREPVYPEDLSEVAVLTMSAGGLVAGDTITVSGNLSGTADGGFSASDTESTQVVALSGPALKLAVNQLAPVLDTSGGAGSVSITNIGRSPTSSGLTVALTLPAGGASITRAGGTGWSCQPVRGAWGCVTSAVAGPGTRLPSLTVELSTVDQTTTEAVLTAAARDPSDGATAATDQTLAVSHLTSPLLTVDSTLPLDTRVEPGGSMHYQLSVSNQGTGAEGGDLELSYQYPNGSAVSATPSAASGWTCVVSAPAKPANQPVTLTCARPPTDGFVLNPGDTSSAVPVSVKLPTSLGTGTVSLGGFASSDLLLRPVLSIHNALALDNVGRDGGSLSPHLTLPPTLGSGQTVSAGTTIQSAAGTLQGGSYTLTSSEYSAAATAGANDVQPVEVVSPQSLGSASVDQQVLDAVSVVSDQAVLSPSLSVGNPGPLERQETSFLSITGSNVSGSTQPSGARIGLLLPPGLTPDTDGSSTGNPGCYWGSAATAGTPVVCTDKSPLAPGGTFDVNLAVTASASSPSSMDIPSGPLAPPSTYWTPGGLEGLVSDGTFEGPTNVASVTVAGIQASARMQSGSPPSGASGSSGGAYQSPLHHLVATPTVPDQIRSIDALGNPVWKNNTITLDGSGSTGTGQPLTYVWAELPGPPAVTPSPADSTGTVPSTVDVPAGATVFYGVHPQVTLPTVEAASGSSVDAPTAFSFELWVTDGTAVDDDTTKVDVLPATVQNPVVSTMAASVVGGTSIRPLSLYSAPGETPAPGYTTTTTVAGPALSALAREAQEREQQLDQSAAAAVPAPPSAGTCVKVVDHASSPDGNPLTYSWSVDAPGSPPTSLSDVGPGSGCSAPGGSTGDELDFVWPAGYQTLLVTAVASDQYGGAASHTLTIGPAVSPLITSIGGLPTDTPTAGQSQTLTLTAESTGGDGGDESYQWSLGSCVKAPLIGFRRAGSQSGGAAALPAGFSFDGDTDGSSVTLDVPVGTAPGQSAPVCLTTTEGGGSASIRSVSAAVPLAAPAALNVSVDAASTQLGTSSGADSTTLTASASGGSGSYTYAWSASDGTTAPSGSGAQATYTAPASNGTYTVTVVATDSATGATATGDVALDVGSPDTVSATGCTAGGSSGSLLDLASSALQSNHSLSVQLGWGTADFGSLGGDYDCSQNEGVITFSGASFTIGKSAFLTGSALSGFLAVSTAPGSGGSDQGEDMVCVTGGSFTLPPKLHIPALSIPAGSELCLNGDALPGSSTDGDGPDAFVPGSPGSGPGLSFGSPLFGTGLSVSSLGSLGDLSLAQLQYLVSFGSNPGLSAPSWTLSGSPSLTAADLSTTGVGSLDLPTLFANAGSLKLNLGSGSIGGGLLPSIGSPTVSLSFSGSTIQLSMGGGLWGGQLSLTGSYNLSTDTTSLGAALTGVELFSQPGLSVSSSGCLVLPGQGDPTYGLTFALGQPVKLAPGLTVQSLGLTLGSGGSFTMAGQADIGSGSDQVPVYLDGSLTDGENWAASVSGNAPAGPAPGPGSAAGGTGGASCGAANSGSSPTSTTTTTTTTTTSTTATPTTTPTSGSCDFFSGGSIDWKCLDFLGTINDSAGAVTFSLSASLSDWQVSSYLDINHLSVQLADSAPPGSCTPLAAVGGGAPTSIVAPGDVYLLVSGAGTLSLPGVSPAPVSAAGCLDAQSGDFLVGAGVTDWQPDANVDATLDSGTFDAVYQNGSLSLQAAGTVTADGASELSAQITYGNDSGLLIDAYGDLGSVAPGLSGSGHLVFTTDPVDNYVLAGSGAGGGAPPPTIPELPADSLTVAFDFELPDSGTEAGILSGLGVSGPTYLVVSAQISSEGLNLVGELQTTATIFQVCDTSGSVRVTRPATPDSTCLFLQLRDLFVQISSDGTLGFGADTYLNIPDPNSGSGSPTPALLDLQAEMSIQQATSLAFSFQVKGEPSDHPPSSCQAGSGGLIATSSYTDAAGDWCNALFVNGLNVNTFAIQGSIDFATGIPTPNIGVYASGVQLPAQVAGLLGITNDGETMTFGLNISATDPIVDIQLGQPDGRPFLEPLAAYASSAAKAVEVDNADLDFAPMGGQIGGQQFPPGLSLNFNADIFGSQETVLANVSLVPPSVSAEVIVSSLPLPTFGVTLHQVTVELGFGGNLSVPSVPVSAQASCASDITGALPAAGTTFKGFFFGVSGGASLITGGPGACLAFGASLGSDAGGAFQLALAGGGSLSDWGFGSVASINLLSISAGATMSLPSLGSGSLDSAARALLGSAQLTVTGSGTFLGSTADVDGNVTLAAGSLVSANITLDTTPVTFHGLAITSDPDAATTCGTPMVSGPGIPAVGTQGGPFLQLAYSDSGGPNFDAEFSGAIADDGVSVEGCAALSSAGFAFQGALDLSKLMPDLLSARVNVSGALYWGTPASTDLVETDDDGSCTAFATCHNGYLYVPAQQFDWYVDMGASVSGLELGGFQVSADFGAGHSDGADWFHSSASLVVGSAQNGVGLHGYADFTYDTGSHSFNFELAGGGQAVLDGYTIAQVGVGLTPSQLALVGYVNVPSVGQVDIAGQVVTRGTASCNPTISIPGYTSISNGSTATGAGFCFYGGVKNLDVLGGILNGGVVFSGSGFSVSGQYTFPVIGGTLAVAGGILTDGTIYGQISTPQPFSFLGISASGTAGFCLGSSCSSITETSGQTGVWFDGSFALGSWAAINLSGWFSSPANFSLTASLNDGGGDSGSIDLLVALLGGSIYYNLSGTISSSKGLQLSAAAQAVAWYRPRTIKGKWGDQDTIGSFGASFTTNPPQVCGQVPAFSVLGHDFGGETLCA